MLGLCFGIKDARSSSGNPCFLRLSVCSSNPLFPGGLRFEIDTKEAQYIYLEAPCRIHMRKDTMDDYEHPGKIRNRGNAPGKQH